MKWSDDDLDLALRDLREEEIPVGAVRARVMAQVARRRSIRWWQWAWVPALAGALFVLAPKESPVEPLPLVARAPGAPVLAAPVSTWKRPRKMPLLRMNCVSPGLNRKPSVPPTMNTRW